MKQYQRNTKGSVKSSTLVAGKLFYRLEDYFTINEAKVLEVFFVYPITFFTVREISRLRNITHPTVITCLQKLHHLGLTAKVLQKNKTGIGNTLLWKANTSAEIYKIYKKVHNLKQLYFSSLIEKIAFETAPNAIVLFGSYAKGEDMEQSDIDLFVISREKDISLKSYEKKLHRKINLTFEPNLQSLNKEFLNNIINGIVLYGYLEVLK